MPKIKIDGKELEVENGTSLLRLVSEACIDPYSCFSIPDGTIQRLVVAE